MDRKTNVLIILLLLFTVAGIWAVTPASATLTNNSSDLLYAADYNHDMIHVYNVTSDSFVKMATIPVEKPSVVVASHDGKRVYAASSGLLTSGLYVISTDNNSVIARYTLPDDGAGAIAISPDDRYVYVVTATRFIILDTVLGQTKENTLDTDRYTTLTAAEDSGTNYAFFAVPGSSRLFVYNGNDGSVTSFHLNCEIGQIKALDSTHLLGTDKLGEINVLKYYTTAGVEGWSYTPHPVGGSSSFFDPYLAVSNSQKLAYYIDRENNRVYKVDLDDYIPVLRVNASEWRSPTKAVFSSDDGKVFICDDTGVMGLYTANDSQYKYFYGYKALDVTVATIQGPQVSGPERATPLPSPAPTPLPPAASTPASGTSPVASATPVTLPSTTQSTGTGGICPLLAVLPLTALLIAIRGASTGRKGGK